MCSITAATHTKSEKEFFLQTMRSETPSKILKTFHPAIVENERDPHFLRQPAITFLIFYRLFA